MPKAVVVAIYDRAVGGFAQPVTTASRGTAVRSFIDEANKQGSPVNAHPSDFELHCLGSFDDETGKFDPEGSALLARGEDVIRNKE